MTNPSRLSSWLAMVSLVAAVPAWAQAPKPRAWAVEIHGGLAIGESPGGGTAVGEFPTGAILTTAGAPSRLVPSWYFGDGARLFREVSASFASAFNQQLPPITPLDPALQSAAARRQGGGIFGVRLSRRLTSRVDLEFGFGITRGTFELTDQARAAIEDTRATFQQAFTTLFTDLTPQTNLRITSDLEVQENRVHQTLVSGGVNVWLTRSGRVDTYVSGGIGRIVNGGTTPQVRLRGNYQFRFLGEYPYNESDSVTINFIEREDAIVGLVGGGVTYELGSRQGIRGDVRVQMSQGRIETSVDAVSSRVTGTPALFVPTATDPSIQISNVASVSSSLSGRLTEFKTFTSDGLDTRILLTVGYFVRF
jgi:hypothetical protein